MHVVIWCLSFISCKGLLCPLKTGAFEMNFLYYLLLFHFSVSDNVLSDAPAPEVSDAYPPPPDCEEEEDNPYDGARWVLIISCFKRIV